MSHAKQFDAINFKEKIQKFIDCKFEEFKNKSASTRHLMNIGIDIRPLMTTPRTGVGEYTYELLNAILRIDRRQSIFFIL